MGYQRSVLFVLLFALVLSACRKEPANEPPHISIITPTENYSINVPDTVTITLSISDDHGVEHVTATLVDQNNIPVVAGVFATPANGQGMITLELPVVSQQLESGTYKILATASDGELSSLQLLPVYLNAVPPRLRAVFTLSQQSANSLALYRTDSLGQTDQITTWPMDFGGAAVSSAAQMLYVAGGLTGPFQALNADNLAESWQVANQSTLGYPWFTGVDLGADGRVVVGTFDGTLRSYIAGNGTGGMVAHSPTDFHPLQSVIAGNLIISVIEHRITHEKRLCTFFNGSGVIFEIHVLTLDPVWIAPIDDEQLLLFGNNNGQGVAQRKSITGVSYSDLYTWSSPIIAASQAGPGVWAVSLANGELRRFTYPNTSSLLIASGLNIQQLAYDEVNGVLYGSGDGQLRAIDPQTGAVLASWPIAGEVKKVLCLLNR